MASKFCRGILAVSLRDRAGPKEGEKKRGGDMEKRQLTHREREAARQKSRSQAREEGKRVRLTSPRCQRTGVESMHR